MRTYKSQKEKHALELYEALVLCMRELVRMDRKHTEACMKGSLARSRAEGMLTSMEDEEVHGVAV